jgi:hypothetical protein
MASTRNASDGLRARAQSSGSSVRPARCTDRRVAQCAVWIVLACAAPARADDDVRVDAETTLQAYDVTSPGTQIVWARRRLTQTLGLGYVKQLADLEPDAAPPASLQVHVRLRLNQEFGSSCTAGGALCFAIVDPQRRGSYTPLVDDGYIDLPYAYVETRDGPFGFSTRLGRQLHWDAIGFARVDGLSARVEPRAWLAFETVFGALVRRTSFAGSDAYVPSVLPRIDTGSQELLRAPYLSPPVTTWIGAASVELGLERVIRLRASYRELAEAGGLLERRFGVGLVSQPMPALRFAADGVLDMLELGLIDAQLSTTWTHDEWHASAQLERHVPRFEPASIWAYFQTATLSIASLRAARTLGPTFDASLGVSGRRTELSPGPEHELGIDAAFTFHNPRDNVSVSGFGWAGGTGPLWGGTLTASRRITLPIRLEAEFSLMRIDDPLRPELAGVSIYELLGARFAVTDESELEFTLSHAQSHEAGHRFAVLAFLHLGAWR